MLNVFPARILHMFKCVRHLAGTLHAVGQLSTAHCKPSPQHRGRPNWQTQGSSSGSCATLGYRTHLTWGPAVRSVFNAFFQLAGCIMFIILLPTAAPRTQSSHYVFTNWSFEPSNLPNNVYAIRTRSPHRAGVAESSLGHAAA